MNELEKNLIIIDGGIADAGSIAKAVSEEQEILILSENNGLAEVKAYLAAKGETYAAIHFFTHGGDGVISLNGESITSDNLKAEDWAVIGSCLTRGGDLLFYGCEIAKSADGKRLIDAIATAAKADAAASIDLTGKDGDWELEYVSGSVESRTITVAGYAGNLTTIYDNEPRGAWGGDVFTNCVFKNYISNGNVAFKAANTGTSGRSGFNQPITIKSCTFTNNEQALFRDQYRTCLYVNDTHFEYNSTYCTYNQYGQVKVYKGAAMNTIGEIRYSNSGIEDNRGYTEVNNSTFRYNVAGTSYAIKEGANWTTWCNNVKGHYRTETITISKDCIDGCYVDHRGCGGAILAYLNVYQCSKDVSASYKYNKDYGLEKFKISGNKNNTTFYRNSSIVDGGAIWGHRIWFTITDCSFTENTAGLYSYLELGQKVMGGTGSISASYYGSGGAIVACDSTWIEFSGKITFTGNQADNYGGAISCHTPAEETDTKHHILKKIMKCVMTAVKLVAPGGKALDTVEIVDKTLCKAGDKVAKKLAKDAISEIGKSNGTKDSSGNYHPIQPELHFHSDAVFERNKTLANEGGAIYLTEQAIAMFDGTATFTNNSAGSDGGAVSIRDHNIFQCVEGVTCTGNTARDSGGAFFIYYPGASSVVIGGKSTFTRNSAGNFDGGAIRAHGTATLNDKNDPNNQLIINEVVFDGNSCGRWGGACRLASIDAHFLGEVTVKNNTAGDHGGGMSVSCNYNSYTNSDGNRVDISNTIFYENVTFSGNTAQYGGGLYVDKDTEKSASNPNVSSTVSGKVVFYKDVTFTGNKAASNDKGNAMYITNKGWVKFSANMNLGANQTIVVDYANLEWDITRDGGKTAYVNDYSLLTFKGNTGDCNAIITINTRETAGKTSYILADNAANANGKWYSIKQGPTGTAYQVCANSSDIKFGNYHYHLYVNTQKQLVLDLVSGVSTAQHEVIASGEKFFSDGYFSGYNNNQDTGGVFYINAGGLCDLYNATLKGNSAKQGGAIYNNGKLYLSNVTISGNTASQSNQNYGSGIYNDHGTVVFYGNVTCSDYITSSGGTISWTVNEEKHGYLSDYSKLCPVSNDVAYTIDIDSSCVGFGSFKLASNAAAADKVNFTVNVCDVNSNGLEITESKTLTVNVSSQMLEGLYNVALYTDANNDLWLSVSERIVVNKANFQDTNGVLTVKNEQNIFLRSYSGNGGVVVVDPDGTLNNTAPVTFQKCSATGSGGVIYDNGGTVTLSDAAFTNNSANAAGGAIYNNGGDISFSSSTFTNNNASGNGGVIFNNNGTITVTDSACTGNSASQGGAIYNNGTAILGNVTFTNNSANADGGVMYNNGGSHVSFDNAAFTGNSAGGNGGVIFNNNGTIIVTDSSCTGNSASQGGAIYNNGTAILGNVTFTNNSANAAGGAIYNNGGDISFSSSTFTNNNASGNGGVIFNNNGTITVTDTTIIGNHAAIGGAIYNYGGTVILGNVTFCGNSVSGKPWANGGAIFNNKGATLKLIETVTLETGTDYITNYGKIEWVVNQSSNGHISDFSKINNGSGWSYAVTMQQLLGKYKLASHASAANGQSFTVSLGGDAAKQVAITVNGGEKMLEGNRISLFTDSAGDLWIDVISRITVSEAAYPDTAGVFTIKNGLDVSNMTYTGNGSVIQVEPDGMLNNTGSVSCTNCSATGNGGVIYDNGGVVTLSNATFTGNSATDGGAVYVAEGGKLTLADVVFSGNLSGCGNRSGAIYNKGTTTLTGSVTLSTGSDKIYNTGELVWDISTSGCGYISDFSKINNTASGTFVITGSSERTVCGTYKLADNAVDIGGYKFIVRGKLGYKTITVNGPTVVYSELCAAKLYTGEDNALYLQLTGGRVVVNKTNFNDTNGVLTVKNEQYIYGGNYTGSGGLVFVESDGTFNNTAPVTFQNCYASENGGVIYNNGVVSLSDTVFTGNSAYNSGGAIYNESGTITVINSTFTGNSAPGGGAIYNESGTITVTDSTFTGNSADDDGVIYNRSGTITITDSTFSGNSASDQGGAIYNNNGTITITASTFTGNSAGYGGAIFNDGTVILGNVIFSGNSASELGGAIYNQSSAAITASTFTGNSAGAGGAIYNESQSSATITDSIFTGNCASDQGGAIFNESGTITITDSIFTGNSAIDGGAIYNYGGTVILDNVTFSDNVAFYGDAIYNDTDGTLVFAGNVTCSDYITNYGKIEWMVNPSANGYISDYSKINNILDWSYAVTIDSSPQYLGKYKLASHASSANGVSFTLSLDGDVTKQISLTVNSGEQTLDGFGVSLSTDSAGDLWLNVVSRITVSKAVYPDTDGVFTIQNGLDCSNISYSGSGGVVMVESDGTFNNTAPITFQTCSATIDGGVIYDNGGVVSLSDTVFTGNHASCNGGVIYKNGGNVYFTDAVFTDNSASSSGGVMYNNGGGNVSFTNAIFTNNSAKSNGGAIFNNGGTITVTDSTFTGNTVKSVGGAIYNNGTAILGNVTFCGNSVSGKPWADGGAIFNNKGRLLKLIGDVTLETNTDYITNYGKIEWVVIQSANGYISDYSKINNGTGWSYVVTIDSSPQYLGKYKLASNASTANGVSFTLSLDGDVTKQISLTVNSGEQTLDGFGVSLSTDSAGDLWLNVVSRITVSKAVYPDTAGVFTIQNGQNVGNMTYDGNGGVIQVEEGGTLNNDGSISFTNCSATGNGGVIYNNGGVVTLTDAAFTGNTAGGNGGAVYLAYSSNVTLSDVTFSGNRAAGNGGAIYVTGGATLNIAGAVTFAAASDTIYNDGTLTLSGINNFAADIYSSSAITASGSTLNFINTEIITVDAVLTGPAAIGFNGAEVVFARGLDLTGIVITIDCLPDANTTLVVASGVTNLDKASSFKLHGVDVNLTGLTDTVKVDGYDYKVTYDTASLSITVNAVVKAAETAGSITEDPANKVADGYASKWTETTEITQTVFAAGSNSADNIYLQLDGINSENIILGGGDGRECASREGKNDIKLTAGAVSTIYGGGFNQDQAAVEIKLEGGTVTGDVFGGSRIIAGTHSVESVTMTIDQSVTSDGQSIYGAGFASGADVVLNNTETVIGIAGGNLGTSTAGEGVFGGGFAVNGAQVNTGNVTIGLTGGTVGNVFGGGWAQQGGSSTVDSVVINVSGDVQGGNIYGGGAHSYTVDDFGEKQTAVGSVAITIDNNTGFESVFAGGQITNTVGSDLVTGDAVITVSGFYTGCFATNLYGEGYNGIDTVGGTSTLNLSNFTGALTGKVCDFDVVKLSGDSSAVLGHLSSSVLKEEGSWILDYCDRTASGEYAAFLELAGGSFELLADGDLLTEDSWNLFSIQAEILDDDWKLDVTYNGESAGSVGVGGDIILGGVSWELLDVEPINQEVEPDIAYSKLVISKKTIG